MRPLHFTGAPVPLKSTGTIPPALRGGALLRNGPGRLGMARHRLDSDGLVTKIAFLDADSVAYRSRHVRTDDRTREHGGCFGGTAHARPHNASNTGVLEWGGRLLTLYESGHPYELDPDTLRTKGPTDLGGAFGPRDAVSAHYRVDADAGRLVMMASDPFRGTVRFVEFDAAWNAVRDCTVGIGGYGFVHDFELAGGDYAFVQNGVRINPLRVVAGQSWAAAVEESGQPSHVVRVDRETGAVLSRTDIGRTYAMHFAGPDHLVAYDTFPRLTDLGDARAVMHTRAAPRMARLDWTSGEIAPVSDDGVEFPSRGATALFAARIGPSFTDGVWRHDLATGRTTAWCPCPDRLVRLDEPVVGPDDLIMVLGQDMLHGAALLFVLDGGRPDMRLVAHCELPESAPAGLHGFFRAPV